jgi:hypothetical protein
MGAGAYPPPFMCLVWISDHGHNTGPGHAPARCRVPRGRGLSEFGSVANANINSTEMKYSRWKPSPCRGARVKV